MKKIYDAQHPTRLNEFKSFLTVVRLIADFFKTLHRLSTAEPKFVKVYLQGSIKPKNDEIYALHHLEQEMVSS